jgi:hypothetical protein
MPKGMTPTLIAILSLSCTLLGVGISKLWLMAVEFTTIREQLAKAKQDNNNLGDKVRQTELKLFYVAMMTTPEDKRQEILNALVRRLT